MKMIFWRRRRHDAQAGNGRCVLIVKSVKVIIRQTESAIASDAATALVNPEDATGVGSSAKPGPGPRDRDMVVIPSSHGRITREMEIADSARQDFGGESPENGRNVAGNQDAVIDEPAPVSRDLRRWRRCPPAASPSKRIRDCPRSAPASRGWPGRSRGRNRNGRRRGCSHRAQCRRR